MTEEEHIQARRGLGLFRNAVSLEIGLPLRDKPETYLPTALNFVENWTYYLGKDRERILPPEKWVKNLVNSQKDEVYNHHCEFMVMDWFHRVCVPTWLEVSPTVSGYASSLRSLPEIVDGASWARTFTLTHEVFRTQARVLGIDLTPEEWDAVVDTANGALNRSGLSAAAGAVGFAPARAAREIVRDVIVGPEAWANLSEREQNRAWDSAWFDPPSPKRVGFSLNPLRNQIRGAEWCATRAAWEFVLKGGDPQPTVENLQVSALSLLDRMLSGRNQPIGSGSHHG